MENDEPKPSLDVLNEHQGNCLFMCCHCKEVFTMEKELNEHIQANSCKYLQAEISARTDTDKKPYVCNMCGAAFNYLNNFLSHKEKHENEFSVKEELNKQLENHKTTHTELSKSLDSPENIAFNAGVLQKQIIFKPLEFLNGMGNKTEFNKNYNVAASNRKSGITITNCTKKLYKCFRCKRTFHGKLQLASHKIKYNMCKCNRRDITFGISLHLKSHLQGEKHGRIYKQSTWLFASLLGKQQKTTPNLRNHNLNREKHHQTNNFSQQQRTIRYNQQFECDQ